MRFSDAPLPPPAPGPHQQRLRAIAVAGREVGWRGKAFREHASVREAISLPRAEQKSLLFAAFHEIGTEVGRVDWPHDQYEYWWGMNHGHDHFNSYCCLVSLLLRRKPELSQDDWITILGDVGRFPFVSMSLSHDYVDAMVNRIERDSQKWDDLSQLLRDRIARVAEAIGMASANAPQQKASERLLTIIRRFEAKAALEAKRPANSSTRDVAQSKGSAKHRTKRPPAFDAATRNRHAALFNAAYEAGRLGEWQYPEFRDRPEIKAILTLPDAERRAMLLQLFDELGAAAARVKDDSEDGLDWLNFHEHTRAHVSVMAIQWMLECPLGLDEPDWARILGNLARYRVLWMWPFQTHLPATFEALSRDADAWTSITPETAALIGKVRSAIHGDSYDKAHTMLR
ncbi:MAG: hypothetical protein KF705_16225, partial [Phycisphaeraceae bacterium]|nr:hypothetical protein [Phycisphaeraceae bacterium]